MLTERVQCYLNWSERNKVAIEIRKVSEALVMVVETGNDYAAGCFVDGLMTVTGCTYGKSNIKKTYVGKMGFILIDTKQQKAVRVQLKPEFFGKMLQSPFVQQRKQGVPPQDILATITDPLVEGVMNRAEEEFLAISSVFDYQFEKTKGTFDTDLCAACGERVFVHKLQNVDNKKICIPCAEKAK